MFKRPSETSFIRHRSLAHGFEELRSTQVHQPTHQEQCNPQPRYHATMLPLTFMPRIRAAVSTSLTSCLLHPCIQSIHSNSIRRHAHPRHLAPRQRTLTTMHHSSLLVLARHLQHHRCHQQGHQMRHPHQLYMSNKTMLSTV